MGNRNSTLLHTLIVKLTALDAETLPGSAGELAQAAFCTAVEAVEPALSAQMHDAQGRKDFALSPFCGYWQEDWLPICRLNDRIFGVFMQQLLQSS